MIVGLTGGIGSGKTTVAKLFNTLGVPVYVSDIAAKRIMISDVKVIKEVKTLLGELAYFDDGSLDKKHISEQVFKNKELLQKLNSIVHPAVADDFIEWYKKQNSAYVIKESAILFESGSYKKCDIIISVISPIKERVNRVMKRDSVTKKQVLHRVMNQSSDEDKIDQSDFIINNITIDATKIQVEKIHNQIIASV
jgi:dephospho-CoA kinase